MADTIEAQCGYCQKRFRLLPEQLNREVLCPHCKTTVRIEQPTATAEAAARALKEPRPGPKRRTKRPGQRPSKRPASRQAGRTGPRQGRRQADGEADTDRPVVSHAGVQSRNVAIGFAVVIGLALVGAIVGLVVVLHDYSPPSGKQPEDTASATPPTPAPPGTTTVPGLEPSGAGTGAAGAADANPAAIRAGGPDVVNAAITADISRLLRGYSGETVTYAVGHITNNTDSMIYAVRIVVELWVSEDGEKVGDATAIILNVPPKYTAPIVAKCTHNPGVRAKYWLLSTYETNPMGVPGNLPALEASDPVPVSNPNSLAPTGLIRAVVTNHGRVPVSDLWASAILLDAKGKIVGATQSRATEKIEPGADREVEIEWRHTAGTLVRNVEVWVQPYYYQDK